LISITRNHERGGRNYTVLVRRLGELDAKPWKNGGGSTRDLAASPPDTTLADFDWRVSIAEVAADGPFSAFPDIDRVIMLVDGAEMILDVDGVTHRLHRFDTLAFAGEATVLGAVPSGPTRDLNLMTRRGSAAGSMHAVDVADRHEVEVGPGEALLLVALTDGLTMHDEALESSKELGALEALDSVIYETPGTVRVSGTGTVAVIRISTLSKP
jgi:environmental stress-induced protein Ves